jgi:hypothetical protein
MSVLIKALHDRHLKHLILDTTYQIVISKKFESSFVSVFLNALPDRDLVHLK